MDIAAEILDWLMEGDPVIRFQVMRDLLEEPEAAWRAEQEKMLTEGWVAEFLTYQKPDGSWPNGRWTEATWMLLLLLDCGIPRHPERLKKAADLKISQLLPPNEDVDPKILKTRQDLCHVGFWLRFGSAFLPGDERLYLLAETIFDLQMGDGGWNCRIRNYPKTVHSSFNTTFNVLEGLREAAEIGMVARDRFETAEAQALEFMLAHRMYKSDKTGQIVHERMTYLTHPSYWHYTVLRGLDYMRKTPQIGDERLADAIELLESQRKENGRWPVQKRIPGNTYFDMEKPGSESRWNTLRALRVLKAREQAKVRLK
ncbi:MAG: hypothetical protein WAM60_27080 [Candidatus Promineifilaceae bacterium]